MDYDFAKEGLHTPEDEPIPDREEEMKKNLAGGYSFKVDEWQALRRWLLTGSMNDVFYQGKEEMTRENIATLNKLISVDPKRVGDEIVEASKAGVSVHTPIFALVPLSMGDKKAKDTFKEIFPQVLRTASHLYEFFNYAKSMRGFGSVIHKAGHEWLKSKKPSELEYQFLKYQSRYGWAGRDILRVLKPKAEDEIRKAVYNWIVGGTEKNPLMKNFPETLERINIYEKLKKNKMSQKEVAQAILDYNLTHEMIPGSIERGYYVWEALFQKMPVGATIRNLGNLTQKGIFENNENLDILEDRLSEENIKKAHIHPVNFSEAHMIYNEGGSLGRGKLTWEPVPRVTDIVENGVSKSFDVLEPTGKHFFHALDVSGSMGGMFGSAGNTWLKPYQVAGVMALSTVKAEKNYFVGGFDTEFTPLRKFRKSTTYQDVTNFNSKVWPNDFGGTDAASAYRYAIDNNINTDVFVFWTDAESWAGGGIFGRRTGHPAELLKEYRNKVNRDAKAIYVTLVPYGDQITLVDPKDPESYDLAGFTSQTPKLIQMIADNQI